MKRRVILVKTGVVVSVGLAGCIDDFTGGGAGSDVNVRVESYDNTVTEGEEVEIQFSVQNRGDDPAVEDVLLEVNGEIEDSIDNLELEAGETREEEFTVLTGEEHTPEMDVIVDVGADDTFRSITVEPIAPLEDLKMEISDIRGLDTGLTSATVSAIFDVENTNSEREIPSPIVVYEAHIQGEEVGSAREEIPTLGPGDSTSKELEINVDYEDFGTGIADAIRERSFTLGLSGEIEAGNQAAEFEEQYHLER